jgi:hypothetical protein
LAKMLCNLAMASAVPCPQIEPMGSSLYLGHSFFLP